MPTQKYRLLGVSIATGNYMQDVVATSRVTPKVMTGTYIVMRLASMQISKPVDIEMRKCSTKSFHQKNGQGLTQTSVFSTVGYVAYRILYSTGSILGRLPGLRPPGPICGKTQVVGP